MRDGATLPTCPNCDEPALLLNLLREAKQKGPTSAERRPPELEINTDWTRTRQARTLVTAGTTRTGMQRTQGAWVRGELVPGRVLRRQLGWQHPSWETPIGSANTRAKMPKVSTT